MKLNRKIQNIGLIVIAGISLIGFIVGTFLDQQITAKIGNYDNIVGILFTGFGPVLTLFVGSLCATILFFKPSYEKKWQSIFFRIFAVILFLSFNILSIREGFGYTKFPRMEALASTYKALMATLIGLIDLATILFVKLYIKKIDNPHLIRTIVIVLLIFAGWILISQSTKYIASRPRPSAIDANPEIAFRNWYLFHPFEAFKEPYKQCKSFVSGHATNSACLITILPLLFTLNKKENNNIIQICALVVGALWAFVVAISRIMARAHYMTDVMA